MADRVLLEPYPGPDDREGFLARTPYHPGFVAELKAYVPTADRRWWEDAGKAWWIAETHRDVVAHMLLRFFGGYERLDPETGELVYVNADGESRQEAFL